jgi:hypothetical protein
MVHRVVWRVASRDALDFWERGSATGASTSRARARTLVPRPGGLELELAVVETGDEPLVADHPEIPRELALQGLRLGAVYAPTRERARSSSRMAWLPAESRADVRVRGEQRRLRYVYDRYRPTAASAARHGPPRRVGLADGRARGLAQRVREPGARRRR